MGEEKMGEEKMEEELIGEEKIGGENLLGPLESEDTNTINPSRINNFNGFHSLSIYFISTNLKTL